MSFQKRILFCGDFCLASGSKGDLAYPLERLDSPWQNLSECFGSDNFIVANLEAPVTDQTVGKPYKWANLRISPIKHQFFKGLSIANLSNNHIGDYGDRGTDDTCAFLESHNISYFGVGNNIDSAHRAFVLREGGCKIGFVSLCCPTTNSEYLATHQATGVAPLSFSTLSNSIFRAKRISDIVFLYLHWGCEWVHDPSPDQLRLARHAIDCGADAVLGCHSHTIQGYEQYKGKWIFYGLGNYCFDAGVAQAPQPDGSFKEIPLTLNPQNRESLVVSFKIKELDGCASLELDRIQPFRFDDDFLPVPCNEDQLSFDLSAANKRLANYINSNAEFLDKRHEVEYKCMIRNGVMAYWYQNESITSPPRQPLKTGVSSAARSLFARLKRAGKQAINRYSL